MIVTDQCWSVHTHGVLLLTCLNRGSYMSALVLLNFIKRVGEKR